MSDLDKCPSCGGPLEQDQEVKETVNVGNNGVLVSIRADVCKQCGELVLTQEMAEKLEMARESLEEEPSDMRVVGHVYEYPASHA